jgi:hypothetical protein
MSAPSRRPEIRRRRTRKDKILQLRKRLTAAKTDADRTRLTAKLQKMAIASPGQPLLKEPGGISLTPIVRLAASIRRALPDGFSSVGSCDFAVHIQQTPY